MLKQRRRWQRESSGAGSSVGCRYDGVKRPGRTSDPEMRDTLVCSSVVRMQRTDASDIFNTVAERWFFFLLFFFKFCLFFPFFLFSIRPC